MRTSNLALSTLALTALLACPAFAEDFNGTFTGSYFSGWTVTINDNPVVAEPSDFEIQPHIMTLRGATSPSTDPVGTASVITITHPVVGEGVVSVGFSSLFFAEVAAHENDSAAFLVNGNVVQDLTVSGVSQIFEFSLTGGDVFGFRLTSDNDNVRDVLQITQVPEPGILGMSSLGGFMLLLWRGRRRSGC